MGPFIFYLVIYFGVDYNINGRYLIKNCRIGSDNFVSFITSNIKLLILILKIKYSYQFQLWKLWWWSFSGRIYPQLIQWRSMLVWSGLDMWGHFRDINWSLDWNKRIQHILQDIEVYVRVCAVYIRIYRTRISKNVVWYDRTDKRADFVFPKLPSPMCDDEHVTCVCHESERKIRKKQASMFLLMWETVRWNKSQPSTCKEQWRLHQRSDLKWGHVSHPHHIIYSDFFNFFLPFPYFNTRNSHSCLWWYLNISS